MLSDCRFYGSLGQTFRGSNGARGHNVDSEPLDSDGNAQAPEPSLEHSTCTNVSNAIPSHGGGAMPSRLRSINDPRVEVPLALVARNPCNMKLQEPKTSHFVSCRSSELDIARHGLSAV